MVDGRAWGPRNVDLVCIRSSAAPPCAISSTRFYTQPTTITTGSISWREYCHFTRCYISVASIQCSSRVFIFFCFPFARFCLFKSGRGMLLATTLRVHGHDGVSPNSICHVHQEDVINIEGNVSEIDEARKEFHSGRQRKAQGENPRAVE